MRTRTQGTILFDDTKTIHPLVEQAKKHQKQLQEESRLRAIDRANRPLLNKHTYPELYERWKANGGGRLPVCRRCREAVIHWNEPAHVCEGYKPQFVDADVVEERYEARRAERHERWEAQREAIREAKANGTFYDECEDDLSGYEDYDEGDYCEGDDDGWECEDDGDPMWD
jgi:hypothetical protein